MCQECPQTLFTSSRILITYGVNSSAPLDFEEHIRESLKCIKYTYSPVATQTVMSLNLAIPQCARVASSDTLPKCDMTVSYVIRA